MALARAFGKPILTLRRHGEELTHPLTDHLQIESIGGDGAVDRICAWLARHINPQEALWPKGKCPYPGLNYYSSAMEAVFFGREEAIRELREVFAPFQHSARSHRIVAVSGPSGSGKSSLVRAGLAGKLARQPGWTVLSPFLPGLDPLQRLAVAIVQARRTLGAEKNAASILEELRDGSISPFEPFFEHGDPDLTYRPQVVIVIDQFEELATATGEQTAGIFLEVVNKLVTGEAPIWLLLTIRSEFLSHPERSNAIIQFLGVRHLNYVLLPPANNRDLLERIIRNPAIMAGSAVDQPFVDRVAKDMIETSADGAALPLLAFALQLAWEHMEQRLRGTPDRRMLILEDYLGTGGLRQVVTERARHATRRLALVGCQDAVFPTLGRFVVPLSLKDRPVRRRLPIDSLKDNALRVAREFEEQRLIRVVDEDGDATFDIVHEAIFETWTDFRDWLTQNSESLEDLTEVERRARTWEVQGMASEDLLRGALLQRVVGLPQVVEHPLLNRFVSESIKEDRENRCTTIRQKADRLAEEAMSLLRHSPRESLRHVVEAALECEQGEVVPPQRLQEALERVSAIARELGCRRLHNSAVRTVTISSTGCMATGGDDRVIKILNGIFESSARQMATLKAGITSLAFVSGGTLLVSATEDGKITLWNLSNDSCLQEADVSPDIIVSQAYDADSQVLACLAESGKLSLWQLPDLKFLKEKVAHSGYGSACAFDRDSKRILTAGADGKLIGWQVPELGKTNQVEAHAGPVCALAHHNGHIATCGIDGSIRLWNGRFDPICMPISVHPVSVSALCFSADAHTVYSGGFDGEIRQWRLDGSEREEPLVGHSGSVCGFTLDPEQDVLVSYGTDRTVRYWVGHGQLLAESEFDFGEPINVLVCLAGSKLLAAADNRIVLISMSTGMTESVWEAHQDYVWGLAVSPDGSMIASASADGTVGLWSVDGKLINDKLLTDHEDDVIDVTFTPQGDSILSGGADGAIRIWSHDGRLLNHSAGFHDGQINAIRCFAINGQTRVISGGNDGFLRLWKMNGERVASREGHQGGVRNLAVSRDGTKLFSVGEDGLLRAWSIDLSESLGMVPAHEAWHAE
ncbi:WD40 repeat domain-containing protein [Desulfosarcina cetonica]|uniref:WD40 repeat domain-containing protein n=1 Tax=Desulfosarcina cetonica TaxID=90730 RepID=UPI0030EE96F0